MIEENTLRSTLQENFIDFTQLPSKLSKQVKNILYRPKKVTHLRNQYEKLAAEMKNKFMRDHLWAHN